MLEHPLDTFQESQQILQSAEQIYSSDEIAMAIDQLAININQSLSAQQEPVLVMPIMNGGLVFSGHLITRLNFAIEIDYLHATRYRNTTQGESLHWKAMPQNDLQGRTLLIVDDIYDEGFTLEAVIQACLQQGAAKVYSVVLVEKNHPRPKAQTPCDFVGLQVEDRYVFGFGMDYKGYHRQLNAIYALAKD